MNKLLKSVIPIFLFLITLPLLFSCKSQKPENLTVDFWEASWDAVEGATEYVVELDGEEYRTKNTTFELFEFLRPDERITVRVEPVFAGDKRKSLWTDTITYTAESVTEGLVYTELADGTYAVSCPEELVLANGELVLPDTHEGAAVTELRNAKNKTNILNADTDIYGKKIKEYDGPCATKIQKVRLPAELKEIEVGAFYKASIEEIYLPSTVNMIGFVAFEGCTALREIYNAQGLKSIGAYAFAECTALVDFEISKTVSVIQSGAFCGAGLTEVKIPDGVKRIEGYTFYNCTALSDIVLSESINTVLPNSLENTAWYHAQPDGVVYIDKFLYGYKGEMPENTKIVIPQGITNMVLRDAFKNQKNLVSVTIPEGFEEINIAAFYGCKNLTEVILPEGITSICANAFYGCSSLEEIILPSSLEHLLSGAFYGCGFKEILLPQMLSSVGATGDAVGVFEECRDLREIIIPESVRTIGAQCFYGCTNLSRLTIPNAVETIGRDAFLYCTSLTELTIPDSVTNFEFNCIAYTGIEHFVFPKNIKVNPFYMPKYANGILLEYLVIQRDTKLLDFNWFYIYSCLDTFYFEGNENEYEQIEKIDKAHSSMSFGSNSQKGIAEWESNLTVYFYSETEPTEEGNYWHYVNGVPAVW